MRSIAEIDRDFAGMNKACKRRAHGCNYPSCDCSRACQSVSECADWDHCRAVGECCPPEPLRRTQHCDDCKTHTICTDFPEQRACAAVSVGPTGDAK